MAGHLAKTNRADGGIERIRFQHTEPETMTFVVRAALDCHDRSSSLSQGIEQRKRSGGWSTGLGRAHQLLKLLQGSSIHASSFRVRCGQPKGARSRHPQPVPDSAHDDLELDGCDELPLAVAEQVLHPSGGVTAQVGDYMTIGVHRQANLRVPQDVHHHPRRDALHQ
jgi:hypothetical protein